jgi:hypothetical protein
MSEEKLTRVRYGEAFRFLLVGHQLAPTRGE